MQKDGEAVVKYNELKKKIQDSMKMIRDGFSSLVEQSFVNFINKQCEDFGPEFSETQLIDENLNTQVRTMAIVIIFLKGKIFTGNSGSSEGTERIRHHL